METINYSNSIRLFFTVVGTLLAGICLSLLPLPQFLVFCKPDIVPMILIYWSLLAPQRIGLMYACILGFLLDVITGVALGTHSVGLILISYISFKGYQRLRVYPIWQQAFYVTLMIFIYRLISIFLLYMDSREGAIDSFWFISFIFTFLFWPWLCALLNQYRRMFLIEL